MNQTEFTCQSYNKTIEKKYIDELGCRILSVATTLYYYDFGYICMGPVILIIVISIFGRIKENYKWFILNQAIWDIFVCSYYSCANLMANWVKKVPTCFYLTRAYDNNNYYWNAAIDYFTTRTISSNPYSAVLLLSTSRFLALYYPYTFEKFTKNRRIFFTIIIFNLFLIILFDNHPLFFYLYQDRITVTLKECMVTKNLSLQLCYLQNDYLKDSWYNFHYNLHQFFSLMQNFKAILFLFLSILATVMIIWKILKQAKFQSKHNKKDFANSVRIVVVIGIQIIINCVGVFLESFYQFIPRLISQFQWKIITTRQYPSNGNFTGYLDLRLPFWLDGSYGLTNDNCRRMIIQFRILIEAFVVLGIMTGYREAVIDFMKFSFQVVFHPWKTIKNFNSGVSQTKVSKILQTLPSSHR